MSYEDVIRVADLKTRRRALRARARGGARRRQAISSRHRVPQARHRGAVLDPAGRRSAGAARLCAQSAGRDRAQCRPARQTTTSPASCCCGCSRGSGGGGRHSLRFGTSRRKSSAGSTRSRGAARAISRWPRDRRCARLLKGYGDTHRRGLRNFELIEQTYFEPAPTACARQLADAIRHARQAALADPEGDALQAALRATAALSPSQAAGAAAIIVQ